MMGAVGDGFDPSEFVSVGVGGVLVLLAGRLMIRLWSSWSEYATSVNNRGTANEVRADDLHEKLNQLQAENGGLRVENAYLKEDIIDLRAEVVELRRRLGEDI